MFDLREADERVLVSVIIPTKDRLADLALTVQTTLRQTVLPDELIIVDQGTKECRDRKRCAPARLDC